MNIYVQLCNKQSSIIYGRYKLYICNKTRNYKINNNIVTLSNASLSDSRKEVNLSLPFDILPFGAGCREHSAERQDLYSTSELSNRNTHWEPYM